MAVLNARRRQKRQHLHRCRTPSIHKKYTARAHLLLKVPCAPKEFSSSFSYSTCTNDFGAETHNKRRF